jgi:hypothetical protein
LRAAHALKRQLAYIREYGGRHEERSGGVPHGSGAQQADKIFETDDLQHDLDKKVRKGPALHETSQKEGVVHVVEHTDMAGRPQCDWQSARYGVRGRKSYGKSDTYLKGLAIPSVPSAFSGNIREGKISWKEVAMKGAG